MTIGIFVSRMNSVRGTPTPSRVPAELGIGGGTSPTGNMKLLPGSRRRQPEHWDS
jgi:hypothetical protein